jgi:hypothetical protein
MCLMLHSDAIRPISSCLRGSLQILGIRLLTQNDVEPRQPAPDGTISAEDVRAFLGQRTAK